MSGSAVPGPTDGLPVDRGETTFFGAPGGWDGSAGKVVLLGVPFDGLTTEGKGAAEAPAALRRASRTVGTYSVRDACRRDRRGCLVDAGDVSLNRFEPTSAFEPIRRCARAVMEAGSKPLLVGGDHSLTYPAVTAATGEYDGLRLIQVDAHFDATDPAEWSCRYNHGTFVRSLIEDGSLAPRDLYQLGVRDFQWSDSGARYLQGPGPHSLTMHDYDDTAVAAMIADLLAQADLPTYVTFDIDSLDPAFAPGTGEHMCGGLTSREAIRLVEGLFGAGLNIVAADLVEVSPPADVGGTTCSLAAHLLAVMADGLARDRQHPKN